MSRMMHYALVGFANSGKSTLFNLLSGSQQKVGNWSGVTVAAKHETFSLASGEVQLSDLPGLSSLTQRQKQGQDLTISHDFIREQKIDCLINVIDSTQLKRQLYLTTQLLELGLPMIVLLNKSDSKQAQAIDTDKLAEQLGCPVLAISARESRTRTELIDYLNSQPQKNTYQTNAAGNACCNPQDGKTCEKTTQYNEMQARHRRVNGLVQASKKAGASGQHTASLSDKIDNLVLHPLVGIPVFLGMMYLLFMFAINVGSAFIDFFDILSGTIFVSYPAHYLAGLNLPMWLLTIIEGIGSGIQTVATFIPVVACLFIGLSLLESSGYLARAAFVVDNVMQRIGLPGKAFVPLIVGFGCTVPAVMSTRVLDSERERLTTVMMAPFMSCGARLPVYALFAAAFFPDNGQNLVFLLYLIGIAAAIFTGFLLKKTILPGNSSLNIMELPLYEWPRLSYIGQRVWQRTKGFVTGAGKTIVIVVCILNFFNSIGTDGEFGHQDSESSLLSQSAKVVMPVLAPLGVKEENWQAGVGIITGIFAKEVLVATFNSLYSPGEGEEEGEPSLAASWDEAVDSILLNLLGLAPDDPLGIDVGEVSDLDVAAQEQEVEITTFHVMQNAFAGQLGAFSYLLFILLYTPCVAAMGAIKNEVGSRWAGFAALWSFALAYLVSTACYQLGNFASEPLLALLNLAMVVVVFTAIYLWLKHQGKKVLTIPVAVSYGGGAHHNC
ncbi:ferrous iron transport protein B [Thalassomonas viridans]|uniref:Ferrous iron transport protein B n=1 Tax=Thalassomonas viridans TaxID=137584 RepID=A0AAF0C9N3_9GAMM|nr:ferrous iron transport protein B [Thalassomonas viridans]WDE05968.1 ferrous iron transport protein B [Thalassomonas viridans]